MAYVAHRGPPLLQVVMFLLISSQTDAPILLRHQSAKSVPVCAPLRAGVGRVLVSVAPRLSL